MEVPDITFVTMCMGAVEHATFCLKVVDSITALPAFYWLGHCQNSVTGWDRSHGLPTLWQHIKMFGISLGTRVIAMISV